MAMMCPSFPELGAEPGAEPGSPAACPVLFTLHHIASLSGVTNGCVSHGVGHELLAVIVGGTL